MSPLIDAVASVRGYLADGGNSPSSVDPTTGKGPEWGEAAPIGLLVIVLLCVAVYFLVKSMNRNLKKVPESFAVAGAGPVTTTRRDAAAGDGGTGRGAAGVGAVGHGALGQAAVGHGAVGQAAVGHGAVGHGVAGVGAVRDDAADVDPPPPATAR